MGNFIKGIFGGGPDTGALQAENKRLRKEQEAEKLDLAQQRASRRRRRLNARGALQFADTGATGVSKTLGGGAGV